MAGTVRCTVETPRTFRHEAVRPARLRASLACRPHPKEKQVQKGVLEPLGAQNFVVEDLDESVASLFTQDAEPETEPEPAAVSSELPS
jgi:hypothetical protein